VLKPVQYWVILVLAAASMVLVAVNAGLYFMDRSAQARVNARARYIQQSQSIGSLYQEIAKALAKRAIDNHDGEVKALLAAEGFTVSPAVNAAEPAAAIKP
jgi:hypothetical protein